MVLAVAAEWWSILTWGLWGVLLAALELWAWKGGAPFRTLSETTWWLRRRIPGLRLVLIGGLGVLISHLAFEVP